MSKILKGLNEVNPNNYDSDWDYQDAVASSGRSRSSYRSQEDDTSDADIAYSKKMYQLSQKQKRDADHDRLATGTNEEQLDELSNKKLGKYKTAAGKDASKADSEGDYKRGDKRMRGINNATKKEFANDTKTVKEDINVVYKKAKQLLTQLDENTQQRVINALKKRVVKEFEGDMETVTAPTTNKPPRQTFSIVLQGKPGKDFGARFVWAALENVLPNDYPPGSEKAEWKIVEVSKKGSAIIKSGINNRDIAETLVAKLVKNKVPAPCLKIISSELDEADEKPVEPFKSTYPRVNNPQILGTQNRAKSIYHPPSKPNVKKLDKPLPENLGNELKSKSLEALQQVKQKLEQQRMAELEQWEKDFKQNTVSKFVAREPNLRQRATSTSMVAMPGEKHSELKARLVQLNKAIEKQGILDNLVQRLDKKGLMTPNIEAGVDTSMLARDGARDNYVELNKKLDKALEYVKNRLLTNKAAYAKPKSIDEDIEMLDEGVLNRLGSIALGLVLAFGASHATADQMYVYQDAGTQKLRIATSLDKVPMNALMSFKVDTDSKTVSMIKGNQETPVQVQPEVVKQAQQQASGQATPQSQPAVQAAPQQTSQQSTQLTSQQINWTMDFIQTKFSEQMQLKDPESVKFKNIKIYLGEKDGKPAYFISGEVNAKNGYGAYVGYTEFASMALMTPKGLMPVVPVIASNASNSRIMYQMYGDPIKNATLIASNGKLVNEQEIDEEQLDELKCWSGYHRVAGTTAGFPGSCAKNKTNEDQHSESCPHCGGEMVSEELMNEKKDACYYKVKSRYKVWPSAYASGALVKCRKKGASNWGNGGKKNESSILEGIERADESLHDWFNKEKWVRMDTKGKIKGPCAREPGEGKPKCLPQSKAHSLGKKGRASAAQRKRREDPNPERSGKAINVDTKKSKG